MYIDAEFFYRAYPELDLPLKKVKSILENASQDIDTLTFNRIKKQGFNNLTLFQRKQITEVCCRHAFFLYENEDMLETYLSSYAINGVNMSFGNSWNLMIENGVAIDRKLYERLCSTGLCCRSFHYG